MNPSRRVVFVCIAVLLVAAPALRAENSRTMSFNGATGLYLIPSAHVGWGGYFPFGVDAGYHIGITRRPNHVANINFTVLRWVELSAAFDLQDDSQYGWVNKNNDDFILGAKVQLPVSPHFVLALGGNWQVLNLNNDLLYHAGQVYAALSYPGTILGMETDTTMVLGKTFYNPVDSNIDFGIGFDGTLLPQYLQGLVHGIIEFSNFSYSVDPSPNFSSGRGILNLGFRFDLSAIPVFSRFKLTLDTLLADCFDANRSFALGLVFGLPL